MYRLESVDQYKLNIAEECNSIRFDQSKRQLIWLIHHRVFWIKHLRLLPFQTEHSTSIPRSSLAEGDEQVDRPNSQTCTERLIILLNIFFIVYKTQQLTTRTNISHHLLLLQSSTVTPIHIQSLSLSPSLTHQWCQQN